MTESARWTRTTPLPWSARADLGALLPDGRKPDSAWRKTLEIGKPLWDYPQRVDDPTPFKAGDQIEQAHEESLKIIRQEKGRQGNR